MQEDNYRWLQFRKYEMSLIDEAKKAEQKQKNTSQDFIRIKSDKNIGNTITFSNINVVPAILTPQFNERPPEPKSVRNPTMHRMQHRETNIYLQKTCAITGLPAKYWDPKTDLPYANLEAFKELRRCFLPHH